MFTPKDKMGDWLESYTKVMELDYWVSSCATGARFDEATGDWVVSVNRAGSMVELRPKHLVIALGVSGSSNLFCPIQL